MQQLRFAFAGAKCAANQIVVSRKGLPRQNCARFRVAALLEAGAVN